MRTVYVNIPMIGELFAQYPGTLRGRGWFDILDEEDALSIFVGRLYLNAAWAPHGARWLLLGAVLLAGALVGAAYSDH